MTGIVDKVKAKLGSGSDSSAYDREGMTTTENYNTTGQTLTGTENYTSTGQTTGLTTGVTTGMRTITDQTVEKGAQIGATKKIDEETHVAYTDRPEIVEQKHYQKIHNPVEHRFVTETTQQTRAAGTHAMQGQTEDLGVTERVVDDSAVRGERLHTGGMDCDCDSCRQLASRRGGVGATGAGATGTTGVL